MCLHIHSDRNKTMTTETILAAAATARTFQEAQAIKLFSWMGPLSHDQVIALSRSADYRAARDRFCLTAGIEGKAFSELVFIAQHVAVWAKIADRPRLRPIATANGMAKASREEHQGKATKTKAADKTEIDAAQAELVAAIKKFRQAGGSADRAVEAVMAGVESDLGFAHTLA